MTTVLLLLSQALDLALWSLRPEAESNAVPAALDPAGVVALKAAGIVAIVAGAAVLARRGMPVAGRAVLLVGTAIGLVGAWSAARVVWG